MVQVSRIIAQDSGVTSILNSLGLSSGMVVTLLLTMAVVGVLIGAYRWFLKFRESGKNVPFIGRIVRSAAGAPQGVADPAKKAALDDLRRKFEEGIEKYRAAGKNVYALPWVLLVGPSGSGKTEVVRHCNVGFPPGLQDYLQGAGGTLNMHWWFTNHAVILDTAGKMFMEESAGSEPTQWKEFLKLLRESRPLAPINGLMLCIGVDSLIKDTADEIQEKAAKIARQLDMIQRTLDVRFPVFVIVTKCDLITGFREFFEKINDPQLQHQMVGWSNPAGLDEPFQPDRVDQHIEAVRNRLLRRRLALVADPVHTEDPQARRADQVDSLFALPDSLAKLAPRLRRYLELIFVAGEWSPKPLFLRGIYFTSSMRQGAELDEDVARILGMSVDALPGGGVSEEKSYFIRDVFVRKVFKEKGLVTRAGNVGKQQRGRRLALVGTGIGVTTVAIILAVAGLAGFRKDVAAPSIAWQQIADGMLPDAAIVKTDGGKTTYRPEAEVQIGLEKLSRAGVLVRSRELSEKPPKVPLMLSPFAGTLSATPEQKISEAQRALVEKSALLPLIQAARAKLASSDMGEWNENTAAVVASLLSIERAGTTVARSAETGKDSPGARSVAPVFDAAKFLAFVLTPEQFEAARSEATQLQALVSWTLARPGATWPPSGAGSDLAAAEKGAQALIAAWKDITRNARLAGAVQLRADLSRFSASEEGLAALADAWVKSGKDDRESFESFRSKWAEGAAAIKADAGRLAPALKTVDAKRIEADLATAEESLTTQARSEFQAALGDESAWNGEALQKLRARLIAARDEVVGKDGISRTVKELRAYFAADGEGGRLVARPDDAAVPVVIARANFYDHLSSAFTPEVGSPRMGGLAAGLVKAQERVLARFGEARAELKGLTQQSGTLPRVAGHLDALMLAADTEAATGVVRAVVATVAGADPAWLRQEITTAAADTKLASVPDSVTEKFQARIKVPLSAWAQLGFGLEQAFNPDAARPFFADLKALNKLFPSGGKVTGVWRDPTLEPKVEAVRASFAGYAQAYLAYWTGHMVKQVDPVAVTSWAELRTELEAIGGTEETVAAAFRRLRESMQSALALDGLLDAGVSPDTLRTWTETLAAESALAAEFAAQFRRERDAWSSLGKTATEAEKTLGQMRPGAFQAELLQSFDCASVGDAPITGPARRFLNRLRISALETLASDVRRERDATLARIDTFKQLPLLMDRGEPGASLTREQILELRRALPMSRSGGDVATLALGGQTTHACINTVLDKIFGLGAQDRFAKLCESLGRWIPWVLGENSGGKLQFEILVMPAEQELTYSKKGRGPQGTVSSYNIYRDVEVSFAGHKSRRSDTDGDAVLLPLTELPSAVDAPLTFTMINPVDKRQSPAKLTSRWTVLELLTEAGAEPIPEALGAAEGEESRVWKVPVTFNGTSRGTPTKFYKWIKVRFNAPVPARSTWPTQEKWAR